MTARQLRGIDALRDAAVEIAPGLRLLDFNGTTRGGLTVKETAEFWGLPAWRICKEIRNRRIKVIGDGRAYIIPVSELFVIASWAEYLSDTG